VYGDLDDTLNRLRGYVAAGADMVFAPAVPAAKLKEIRAAIEAPVMVAADLFDAPGKDRPGSTLAEYADAGADVLLLWYSLIGAAAKSVMATLTGLASGAEVAELGDLILGQQEFESAMDYAAYERRAARYQ
jgi:methylisocitrate lyase